MGFHSFFSALFDDIPFTTDPRASFVDNAFSDLLSYRLYDPEQNLFHNEGSVGFILECAPFVSPDMFQQLRMAVTSYCPSEGSVQFISWASPNIDATLGKWAARKHVTTPLAKRMTDHRIRKLRAMTHGSNAMIKAVPHNRRIFVIGWVDALSSPSVEKSVLEFRRNLQLALGGETECVNVQPGDFIQVLAEVFHARPEAGGLAMDYDEELPLNYQVPGAGIAVGRDGLTFLCDQPVSASCASVRAVPAEWDARLGLLFNGSPERPNDAPHGPVLMSLVARGIPTQSATNDITVKRAKLEHQKSTKFGNFVTDLAGKAQETANLHSEIERGERMFETVMSVCAFASGDIDESRAALAEMVKIFSVVGIVLERDSFLQLPLMLGALPFQTSKGVMADFARASRVRKRKGAAVVSLAPMHGEWSGFGKYSSMLLVGRQGQVFDWDNFESSGNYNVAVVGKSGAGKSVFMQELICCIYGGGGRVLIIDDGYSFKTTCDLFGGQWMGIGASEDFRMNPFSMLDFNALDAAEYRADALELITRVVATMANLGEQREGRVAGIEEEFISDGCAYVLDTMGGAGTITDVVAYLEARLETEPRLKDVITKLKRYARGGIYGQMFDGPANVSIKSTFTVFELSELKGHKELEAVVLQIIMFLGTELMFKTDRATRVAILIDEAWDMLDGFGTSGFLEGVVRRARKYSGALITGTQSLDDYWKNAGARVCYENSDWLVALSQKPEVIDQLVSDGRLTIPPGIAHALKTLVKVPGEFSELAIRGPEGFIFGRLVLDPYSIAVFSTKGETVARLKDLRETRGLAMEDALEVLIEEGGVL